jgi:flagellar motor protein MotB
MSRKAMIFAGVVFVVGLVIGFVLRPIVKTDSRIGELEGSLAASETTATTEKARADKAQQALDTLTNAKQAVDKKLLVAETELAGQQRSAADKTKELETLRDKLKAASDKSIGAPAIEGDSIRLTINAGVLFKGTDDQLSDRGKAVLTKLAGSMKEMNDRQISVIGHTDDTPPVQPKAPKAPPPPPPKKGQKPVPAPAVAAPVSRFPTNWELASLRAIAVVHHLQSVAKLDPARLAAQSYGQYKPVSRTNKGLNRRIEIVVAPKPAAR